MSRINLETTDNLPTLRTTANANFTELYTLEDSRLLKCAVVEQQTVTSGSTQTIASLTGAGNIEGMQIAFYYGDADTGIFDSTVSITVDGGTPVVVPMGIFFLNYGAITADYKFRTDDLAVTRNNAAQTEFGGYRRIFIPFVTSCLLQVTNNSSMAGSMVLYTQIQHRSGAIPVNKTGTRRVTWHAVVVPVSTTITQFASLKLLDISGFGMIESIHIFEYGQDTVPGWMEGDPTLVIDGVTTAWGGQEDFFGTQFYGVGDVGGVSASWGIPMNRVFNSTYFGTGMFRRFVKDPLCFDATATFTIYNGESGQSTPPTVNCAAMIEYYTSP